jgi:hypothetical protein
LNLEAIIASDYKEMIGLPIGALNDTAILRKKLVETQGDNGMTSEEIDDTLGNFKRR